ncbi:DUF2513 domain-containing protein [Ferrimonas balearica]|uniref:DUF2513 domain-containing protein n=1 Tax=Ferrimonas balearica TaxID=44012 RepID=UPI001C58E030|nr:DUF2513 domain-containing protein [Ferrimonas balearica]MBW3140070.1 DUF2513 domain-containing protein [Ferrimonas balearica]
MKRDMELGRKILLVLEEKEDFSTPIIPEVPEHTKIEVAYHIKLLHQAGLVEAINWSSDSDNEWEATTLTSIGHDFLDAARNETIWKKSKAMVLENGAAMTFEMMKIALTETLKAQLLGSPS